MLGLFGVINFKFSILLNVIAVFDVCVVLSVIFMMLAYGADINEQFLSHKCQLIEIKQNLIFIQTHIEDFNNESRFTGTYLKMC